MEAVHEVTNAAYKANKEMERVHGITAKLIPHALEACKDLSTAAKTIETKSSELRSLAQQHYRITLEMVGLINGDLIPKVRRRHRWIVVLGLVIAFLGGLIVRGFL